MTQCCNYKKNIHTNNVHYLYVEVLHKAVTSFFSQCTFQNNYMYENERCIYKKLFMGLGTIHLTFKKGRQEIYAPKIGIMYSQNTFFCSCPKHNIYFLKFPSRIFPPPSTQNQNMPRPIADKLTDPYCILMKFECIF